jgi:hypothetical protein
MFVRLRSNGECPDKRRRACTSLKPEPRVEVCANLQFVKANRRIDLSLFPRLQTGAKACDRSPECHGRLAGNGYRTGSHIPARSEWRLNFDLAKPRWPCLPSRSSPSEARCMLRVAFLSQMNRF